MYLLYFISVLFLNHISGGSKKKNAGKIKEMLFLYDIRSCALKLNTFFSCHVLSNTRQYTTFKECYRIPFTVQNSHEFNNWNDILILLS